MCRVGSLEIRCQYMERGRIQTLEKVTVKRGTKRHTPPCRVSDENSLRPLGDLQESGVDLL